MEAMIALQCITGLGGLNLHGILPLSIELVNKQTAMKFAQDFMTTVHD
jgi:hypothetical protein